jgi:hypothetical protein
MPVDRNFAWTTDDELKFISKLGTFSDSGKSLGKTKLLERYRKAFSKRVEWDSIDAMRVMALVKP